MKTLNPNEFEPFKIKIESLSEALCFLTYLDPPPSETPRYEYHPAHIREAMEACNGPLWDKVWNQIVGQYGDFYLYDSDIAPDDSVSITFANRTGCIELSRRDIPELEDILDRLTGEDV